VFNLELLSISIGYAQQRYTPNSSLTSSIFKLITWLAVSRPIVTP
jgi:hypothetical protein